MINAFEPLPLWVSLGVALACVFIPYVGKVSEWFSTIIHEVGHAVTSLITGGGIHSIKLRANGSGETNTLSSVGFFSWFRRIFVLFSGYSAPLYLGLFLLWAVKSGHTQIAFYVVLGTAILTLIFIRNFFGILIVLLYFGYLALNLFINNGALMSVGLVLLAFILIARGIVDLVEAARIVFSGQGNSDFDFMAQSTFITIPAQVWYVVYVLGVSVIFAFFAILVATSPIVVA